MSQTPHFQPFLNAAVATVERQIAADVDELIGELRGLALRDVPSDEHGDDRSRWCVDGWDDDAWAQFPPDALSGYSTLARVGTVRRVAQRKECSFAYAHPALVPVLGVGNVVFRTPTALREAAAAGMQSLILRLLATTMTGKVRLTLIDAAGFGQNFASLMRQPELVRGAQAWHHPRDIERELSLLTAKLATIVQERLTNEYPDILAYNRSAGVVAEPFRVLAIANLPAGFNDRLWDHVVSLAEHGPRAGIHVIATLASDEALPHKCDASDLLRHAVELQATGERSWSSSWPPLASSVVEFDAVDDARASAIAQWVTEKGRHADRIRVDFASIAPDEPWTGRLPSSEDDCVEVAIGRHGARERQMFRVQTGTSQHALIGGMAGSGKSVLLHALILALATRYRPGDVDLYLIDLKEGVEFVPYKHLPHARVVATETEREFALSVLKSLGREMERRGAEFRKHHVADLSSWHGRALGPMPVVVLVMDEFQVLLDRPDRICTTARALLDDFARRGRGFGIHLVLATQSLASVEIEASTLGQLGIRIALRMPESDSFRVLAKDNDAASRLERAGQALYSDGCGQRGTEKEFQVAYLERPECEARIADLAARAQTIGWTRMPIVFDGAVAARLETDAALAAAWRAPPTVSPKALPLHLGEPVAVDDRHTHARLRRQGRSNLLIVGPDEEDALATFTAACASACVFAPARSVVLQVLDLTNIDSPHHGMLDALCGLPQEVTVWRINQRRGASTIEAVAEEVAARLADEARPRPGLLLAIFGIQRLRELQKDGYQAAPLARKLSTILQDGPDVGVHSIIAADAEAGLGRVMEPKEVEQFESRVVLQGGGESSRLLGEHTVTARSLRRRYGLLYEVDTPTELQKFKCYEVASLAAFLRSGPARANQRPR